MLNRKNDQKKGTRWVSFKQKKRRKKKHMSDFSLDRT